VAEALLFEQDKVAVATDWEDRIDRLGRSSILWIDFEEPDESALRHLVQRLELDDASEERLLSAEDKPYLGDFGSYVHATAFAPAGRDREAHFTRMDCLVSKRWVVTVHREPVPVFDDFRDRAGGGSGHTGKLDGLEFLANLLEWVLNAYFQAFDEVENALGEFDLRVMEGGIDDAEAELRRLVELRRQVGALRGALVSHREMFLALTRPELEAIANWSHAERFSFLRDRLEDAVQGAHDTRDSIVGSFDVLIAERTANERDHEGADVGLGAVPAGSTSRRCVGDELPGRAVRPDLSVLGLPRVDRRTDGRHDRDCTSAEVDLAALLVKSRPR
jgi:Mg2+ and Co2+ transporter CorA